MSLAEDQLIGLRLQLRRCAATQHLTQRETRNFSTLPNGLRQLKNWLPEHQVQAAAIEAAGIYWTRPFEALSEAGIELNLYHSQRASELRSRKK